MRLLTNTVSLSTYITSSSIFGPLSHASTEMILVLCMLFRATCFLHFWFTFKDSHGNVKVLVLSWNTSVLDSPCWVIPVHWYLPRSPDTNIQPPSHHKYRSDYAKNVDPRACRLKIRDDLAEPVYVAVLWFADGVVLGARGPGTVAGGVVILCFFLSVKFFFF